MTAIRRTLTVLAGIATALSAAAMLATAAFAQVPPPEPAYLKPAVQAPTVTATTGGTPWWVFAIVAAVAAALALAAVASLSLRHPGGRPVHT